MPLCDEAGRCSVFFVETASGYFKKSVTGPALKMMMMFLAGSFVDNTFFKRVYFLEPSFFNQDFQVAIDSGLIEGSDFMTARFKDFMDAERPVYVFENFPDSGPLTCFSLHALFRKISS